MFSPLRKFFRPRTKQVTALDALAHIKRAVERLNVPVVADDVDAGYDMAIDEVIDIISDYEKALSTPIVGAT